MLNFELLEKSAGNNRQVGQFINDSQLYDYSDFAGSTRTQEDFLLQIRHCTQEDFLAFLLQDWHWYDVFLCTNGCLSTHRHARDGYKTLGDSRVRCPIFFRRFAGVEMHTEKRATKAICSKSNHSDRSKITKAIVQKFKSQKAIKAFVQKQSKWLFRLIREKNNNWHKTRTASHWIVLEQNFLNTR